MGSLKNQKKAPAKAKSKCDMLFDNTVSTAEDKIEGLAEKLVADGTAGSLGEAQEMVLKDPANSGLRQQYEGKFRA